VHGYQRAVKLAPRAVRENATQPHRDWEQPTHVDGEVPGLQKYLRPKAFNVRGKSSSAYAHLGDTLMTACTESRNVHVQAGAQVNPAVAAMRVHAGIVGLELGRLFHAAEDSLSHESAHKLSVAPLRNGRGKAHSSTAHDAPTGGETPGSVAPSQKK
jgi:hypothetical protein